MLVIKVHIVSGAGQLLGSGHACGPGTNDGDFSARKLGGRLRINPAFGKAFVNDGAFNGFDGHWIIINIQGTRSLARCGADATGKFGKIVG